jgi:hypothetical protein
MLKPHTISLSCREHALEHMNGSPKMSVFMPPACASQIDEPVDVVRIRLRNPKNVTALLSECHSVDRVLDSWAAQPGCNPVEFEVTFFDGYVVQGSHDFFHKGKRKCLFSTHLRKVLQHLHPPELGASPALASDVSRYFVAL